MQWHYNIEIPDCIPDAVSVLHAAGTASDADRGQCSFLSPQLQLYNISAKKSTNHIS